MRQQSFRRWDILGEIPDAPVIIAGRVEATFRSLGRRKGPQLLGYLRRVAPRDRISARRIKDQGRLTRDNRFVVRRVVISEHLLWERFREFLEPFQNFLD